MVVKKENKSVCPVDCQDCISKMMQLVGFVLVVLALFLLVKTYGVFKENGFIGQDIYPQNTISVIGEGEVTAIPDVANFSFSVIEEAKTVEQAQKLATEKMNAVLGFLNKEGINQSEIKTTGYNIYPRYEWWSKEADCEDKLCPPTERQRVLISYEVSQNISVKLKNVELAGKILAGIGSFEVSNISGLNFDIDEKEELQRQARQEAIEKAQVKAKELAKDLGVKLGRMISYSTNEGNDRGYAYAEKAMFGMGGGDMTAPEIPVGENEIKIKVYMTYEIK